jgi:hypothetical protein
MALACFGFANKTRAQTACLPNTYACTKNSDCCSGHCKWHFESSFDTRVKVWTCVS